MARARDTEERIGVISERELAELRLGMAELREYVDSQVARMQREADLIRAEVRATQEMIGALMAALAQR